MRSVTAILLFTASALVQAAESYPAKPIRLILPVSPGGGADITARTIVPKLVETWGQQVIIDNRPGAGGVAGMTIAAAAAPDGYTIVTTSLGPVAVDVSLHSKLPYHPARA